MDKIVKIWSLYERKIICNLRGHTKEVSTICWSPVGRGTIHAHKTRVLASASYDSTVRLWETFSETSTPRCTQKFKHYAEVFSIAFSPNGKYLASGSKDKSVCIWSTQHGNLVHRYQGPESIIKVCWNSSGNKVGFSGSAGSVFVLDLRNFSELF